MHSRICSLSRSFRECYFCLYPTCLKYLAKWQVITRIICHFLVRKASDNCYCDNFFDIVAAQIMLTVHADFWHVHAKFNRGAHNNVMIIIFSWFFWGKDAPAISIFSRPLYVAQSKMNDPFNQIWKSNIKYFKTNSVYYSTLSLFKICFFITQNDKIIL